MLIYIDTNVWLDYFLNRQEGILSDSEIALAILQRAVSCEFEIIITPVLIVEIEKYVSHKSIESLLKWLGFKIKKIDVSIEEKENSKKIQIHYPDCLHYYIAEKYNATLISNDKELQDLGAISARIL